MAGVVAAKIRKARIEAEENKRNQEEALENATKLKAEANGAKRVVMKEPDDQPEQNALLYVGLGLVAVGLVITTVGVGDKGFQTIQLKLVGPALVGFGLFLTLVRIMLCTIPSTCQKCRRRVGKSKQDEKDEFAKKKDEAADGQNQADQQPGGSSTNPPAPSRRPVIETVTGQDGGHALPPGASRSSLQAVNSNRASHHSIKSVSPVQERQRDNKVSIQLSQGSGQQYMEQRRPQPVTFEEFVRPAKANREPGHKTARQEQIQPTSTRPEPMVPTVSSISERLEAKVRTDGPSILNNSIAFSPYKVTKKDDDEDKGAAGKPVPDVSHHDPLGDLQDQNLIRYNNLEGKDFKEILLSPSVFQQSNQSSVNSGANSQ